MKKHWLFWGVGCTKQSVLQWILRTANQKVLAGRLKRHRQMCKRTERIWEIAPLSSWNSPKILLTLYFLWALWWADVVAEKRWCQSWASLNRDVNRKRDNSSIGNGLQIFELNWLTVQLGEDVFVKFLWWLMTLPQWRVKKWNCHCFKFQLGTTVQPKHFPKEKKQARLWRVLQRKAKDKIESSWESCKMHLFSISGTAYLVKWIYVVIYTIISQEDKCPASRCSIRRLRNLAESTHPFA